MEMKTVLRVELLDIQGFTFDNAIEYLTTRFGEPLRVNKDLEKQTTIGFKYLDVDFNGTTLKPIYVEYSNGEKHYGVDITIESNKILDLHRVLNIDNILNHLEVLVKDYSVENVSSLVICKPYDELYTDLVYFNDDEVTQLKFV